MSHQVGMLGRCGRGVRTPRVPLAVCVGTRSSPRRAGAPPPVLAVLAGSPVELEDEDSGEDEDNDPPPEELQPLLSPLAGIIQVNAARSTFVESPMTNDGFTGTLINSPPTSQSENDDDEGDDDADALLHYFERAGGDDDKEHTGKYLSLHQGFPEGGLRIM